MLSPAINSASLPRDLWNKWIDARRKALNEATDQDPALVVRRKNSLAWALATVPIPDLRDPDRAVQLACDTVEEASTNAESPTSSIRGLGRT